MNRPPALDLDLDLDLDSHRPQARLTDDAPRPSQRCAAGVLALLLGLSACGARPDSSSSESQPTSTSTSHSEASGADDHPLRAWMRSSVGPAMASESREALSRAFDRMAGLDLPDYPGWQSMASAGADAARAGDLDECRATCKRCHDQHRQAYRAKDRGRPLR
jgi:hypothetical protein